MSNNSWPILTTDEGTHQSDTDRHLHSQFDGPVEIGIFWEAAQHMVAATFPRLRPDGLGRGGARRAWHWMQFKKERRNLFP
jgi:hypothetical protein